MAKSVFEKIFKGRTYKEILLQDYIQATDGRVDLLNRAYAKLGLSPEYFKEQPNLKLAGFDFGEFSLETPKIKHFKKQKKFVSEVIYITYLLFGSRQLYVYNVALKSDASIQEEMLTEIFYKDIAAISVESGYNKVPAGDKADYAIYNSYMSITYGGEKLTFPTLPDFDINNEQLFAARKFIRDKKILS